jgi:hypothetical protein
MGFSLALPRLAAGADPHIDKIEPYPGNQYTLHFYTEANRTYFLQCATAMKPGAFATNTTDWVTIYTFPSLPFEYHYVFTDQGARTNKLRFYRLAATP